MRMIPSAPFRHGQSGGKTRSSIDFRRAFDERYAAYHSLKPTRHPNKRFPEIDFVICGPEGLYVLEVKGGRIALSNGAWNYQDRYGRITPHMESPFRQAEAALHGLTEKLCAHLSSPHLSRLRRGYGVVFPDCEWQTCGSEWDPEMIADRERSRDMEGWLRQLFEYWKNRGGPREQVDDDTLRIIREHIRPNVNASISLHEAPNPLSQQVEDAERRIDRMTEDQMRMSDVAEANPRVLCAGGAGTGKTFLAERLARRWSEYGMQVVLVCRSPWLRHHLASRLAIPGLTVSLIDGVRLDCCRAGLDSFDVLIVDEGQDLFDMASINILNDVLADGLEKGRWCWFHDLNNQALSKRFEPSAREYLESINPVHVPLFINCRNTRIILEWVQDTLGADVGTRGAGAGPEVRRCTVSSQQESAERVAQEIAEFIDIGGLAPGSVTILSPFDYPESSVAHVPAEVADRICRLDEYSVRNIPGDKVGFARIDEFKGLENEAIIVVDLSAPNQMNRELAAQYVATTRARSLLSIVQRESRF